MKKIMLLLSLALAAPAADIFPGAQVQEILRIRMDRGDLVLETIQDAIKKHNIQDGAVLTAAGSLDQCTYHRVKSMAAKPEDEFLTVKGPIEILNINGMIAA